MPKDFTDPVRRLEQNLEDLRVEIDMREKELRQVEGEYNKYKRRRELLLSEIEDLKEEEERLEREIEKMRLAE